MIHLTNNNYTMQSDLTCLLIFSKNGNYDDHNISSKIKKVRIEGSGVESVHWKIPYDILAATFNVFYHFAVDGRAIRNMLTLVRARTNRR